jgi:hypothetical protein
VRSDRGRVERGEKAALYSIQFRMNRQEGATDGIGSFNRNKGMGRKMRRTGKQTVNRRSRWAGGAARMINTGRF